MKKRIFSGIMGFLDSKESSYEYIDAEERNYKYGNKKGAEQEEKKAMEDAKRINPMYNDRLKLEKEEADKIISKSNKAITKSEIDKVNSFASRPTNIDKSKYNNKVTKWYEEMYD